MKRQVAIIGPTPEFLRWAVRKSCPLRDDLVPGCIDATEKRLRAIRIAGLAMDRRQVYDGIAAKLIEDRPKAFRIDEVFRVFGGVNTVTQICESCSANILSQPNRHGRFAGCHGWLSRNGLASLVRANTSNDGDESQIDLALLFESAMDQSLTSFAGELFPGVNKVWYAIWAERVLSGQKLQFANHLVRRVIQQSQFQATQIQKDIEDFSRVLEICCAENLMLDVELIPPGYSDGIRWTISAHCVHCRSTFSPEQNGCCVCQKSGKGHPEIHRKVRGLRPWVDLEKVIGPDRVASFLSENKLRHGDD